MKRSLLICALALVALPGIAPAQTPSHAQPRKPSTPAHHTFATEGDHFTLDGKPFKVLSGELHYARIPREYWHARLKMAKAMGLNTIATYVFWNVHEPTPGHYDFTGQYDLAAFIRAAQQEGLYVILRSGPYACAEWDLGGLPAWLLADPKSAQAIRTNDPAFMTPAERWITRLSKEVLPLQIARGGPILMTQIENEYGQFGDDHTYISHLHDIYVKLGFTDSLLYTADNWRHIPEGSLPGLFASVNFGIKNHQGGMDALAKARPSQAQFVSEYWPGWFDHWGHPHETRPIAPQIEDVDYILTRGAGINIYMFHGGTSFGFGAGSSYINSKFLPDVTSYDYDAPLDESGRPTPKYFAYRKELAKFATCSTKEASSLQPKASTPSKEASSRPERSGVERPPHFVRVAEDSSAEKQTAESCLPPVPTVARPITIPTIALTKPTSLFDTLPNPIASALPAPMEHFAQDFGYILYRTRLPEPAHGGLAIRDVHDFATVYVDGKLAGTLDRRNAAPDGRLPTVPIATTGPAQLDILVANDGRVNVDHTMRTETKGITQLVVLDGRPLSDWRIYPLPMTELPALSSNTVTSKPAATESKSPPPSSNPEKSPGPHCGFAYGDVCPPVYQPVPHFVTDGSLPPGPTTPGTSSPSLTQAPAFFRAHFTLTAARDTFLDTRNLGKGVVWINGHNLGRFWSVGPQQTLYVPGPWLHTGSNVIVVFDMLPTAHESISGLDHPILDAPVNDKTTRNQE